MVDEEKAFAELNPQYGYGGKINQIREKEFSRLRDIIYLDHAGTTLYSDTQIKNVTQDLLKNTYGNPHSQSSCSSRTTDQIEQVRDQILQFFNTSNKHYYVIFTSGCTDSLKKVGEWFPWSSSSSFVYSSECHNSVVGMREYALKHGATFNTIDSTALHNKIDFELISSYLSKGQETKKSDAKATNLFVLPAQCNFSGRKYNINAISSYIKSNFPQWRVLIDGASFVGTSPIDLSDNQIDYLAFSFHKMIGYPTGLGALVVRKEAATELLESKTYFGGGTVEVSISQERYHVLRPPPLGLEDGTLSFLSIISIPYGLNYLTNLGMSCISSHVGSLLRYVVQKLRSYHHPNGSPVVTIYGHDAVPTSDPNYDKLYGGVISFSLLQPDGSYIPYSEVDKIANLYNIQLRTGCFCNPGACHGHLGISSEDAKSAHSSGHVCWDDTSLLNGRPTGAIRVSLGYMSSFRDVQKFLQFIEENYVFIPETEACIIENEEESIYVEKIVIYPVKSCAGYEVSQWQANGMGLLHDREWALVDSKGVYVNQKKVPLLCLVRPIIDLENGYLHLTAPNTPQLSLLLSEYPQSMAKVDLENPNRLLFDEELSLRICGDNCAGFAYGKEVTSWFTDVTGTPNLVLVRKNPDKQRASRLASMKNPESDVANIRFSNESPYLLVSSVSVSDLVSRIPHTTQNINYASFRANIVVKGGLRPYEEDEWQTLDIGGQIFTSLGGCNRCKMITIDQAKGSEGQEPLRTLAFYRRATTGRILFGIHVALSKEEEFTMRVGDVITIKPR